MATATLEKNASALIQEFQRFEVESCAPQLRSIRNWAEAEVIIPDGKFRYRPFRADRVAWNVLLLQELESEFWLTFVCQGPTQSGKTFLCFVIPLLYHLFELMESVVVGVADGNMARDKWTQDIRPVIKASPAMRRYLPATGTGSRDGTVTAGDAINFTNGSSLKFLSPGGKDESKAGYTSRVACFTEAKRFSASSANSVESSPRDQILGRLLSYDWDERREYLEGTVGVAEELPWKLRTLDDEDKPISSESKIVVPCPHCKVWISPGRADLKGWQDAQTKEQAAQESFFACPSCGHKITGKQRKTANQKAKLIHRGQQVNSRGRITGPAPDARTLFFHYNHFHNTLLSAGSVGMIEWEREQHDRGSREYENLEKKLTQQFWSIPYEPAELDLVTIKQGDVRGKAGELPRGRLPIDTQWLTIGVDVGMYRCHWVAIAWCASLKIHVVDYGTFEILQRGAIASEAERQKAVELKLWEELDTFAARCRNGWDKPGGEVMVPDVVLVDSNYLTDTVIQWTVQAGDIFLPAIGRGTGDYGGESYSHPSKKTDAVRYIGEEYHLRMHKKHNTVYVLQNADYWKSWFQRRFKTGPGQPGSVTLFDDQEKKHRTYEKHIRSEQVERQLHPKKGWIDVHVNSGSPNHFLDSSYLACVGGNFAGFSFVERRSQKTATQPVAVDEHSLFVGALEGPDGARL